MTNLVHTFKGGMKLLDFDAGSDGQMMELCDVNVGEIAAFYFNVQRGESNV